MAKASPIPLASTTTSRVIDELLADNITPYVTLFHWDLPAALPGGWQNRDTSKAFADYAAFTTRHLADRVHHWMTTNEFVCFTDLGYAGAHSRPASSSRRPKPTRFATTASSPTVLPSRPSAPIRHRIPRLAWRKTPTSTPHH